MVDNKGIEMKYDTNNDMQGKYLHSEQENSDSK